MVTEALRLWSPCAEFLFTPLLPFTMVGAPNEGTAGTFESGLVFCCVGGSVTPDVPTLAGAGGGENAFLVAFA